MSFEILQRWTNAVLYKSDLVSDIHACVTEAVQSSADLCDANLMGANLSSANLRGANLCDADLRGANLRGADLCDVNLCDADLSGANLRGANLCDADLRGANLCGAVLSGANLRGAVLSGADLSGANLCGANLSGADLSDANLSGANLRGVVLSGADLSGANLSGANLDNFKQDLIAEVLKMPAELEALRGAIIDGKIDGSSYSKDGCYCLAGTISNACGKTPGISIPINGLTFRVDSNSPRECWFMMIKPGDTPETNQAAKLALEWVDEAIAIRDHIRQRLRR